MSSYIIVAIAHVYAAIALRLGAQRTGDGNGVVVTGFIFRQGRLQGLWPHWRPDWERHAMGRVPTESAPAPVTAPAAPAPTAPTTPTPAQVLQRQAWQAMAQERRAAQEAAATLPNVLARLEAPRATLNNAERRVLAQFLRQHGVTR